MAGIRSVHLALPGCKVSISDMPQVADLWLSEYPDAREKLNRISSASGVENRNYIQSYEETLNLNGLHTRAALFESLGEPLLGSAIKDCLEESAFSLSDYKHLIFTSCSVPVIPSLDAKVALNLGLSEGIFRIPIFQHGCVGGVAGLSLGSRLASLGHPLIVSSLELCSLVFHPGDFRGSQLVGASLFADGAAALVIEPGESRLNFVDSTSYLIPESRHLMGYDIQDDGFHLRLDRALPSVLTDKAPSVVGEFLNRQGLKKDDINYWLFHPGGKKILDYFEEIFGLASSQCRWAREVLRDFGNMSSATIFYVLHRFLAETRLTGEEKILVFGIGPGLTLEMILFEASAL